MRKYLTILLISALIALLSCDNFNNNYLKELEIQGSVLTPSFSKEITEYTVNSLNSLRPIVLKASPEDINSVIKCNYKISNACMIKIDKLSKNKFIEITVTAKSGKKRTYKIRTLPKDFPLLAIKEKKSPAEGYIFLTNFSLDPKFRSEYGRYLMIVDNNGQPVFYRKETLGAAEFKMHPNGNLSFFSGKTIKPPEIFGNFYTLDKNFKISGTFNTAHGYTDMHDFKLLENGNVIMLGVDIVQKDMSQFGGKKNAKIWDYFIEERDSKGKIIQNWQSFGNFKVSDMISAYDLTLSYIEHGANCNSIWIDSDENLLLSSRKLDEITKIDRKTGKIIWRMGGVQCKNNQFKFIDDRLNGFSHQHSISVLKNGNLLMLDNGNYNSKKSKPDNIFFIPQTRIVEYQIDEAKKTAKLVWEFKKPGIFIPIMGSIQRLDNGNTFICWSKDSPCITEVDANGKTVLEIDLPVGFKCYSAFKYKLR